MPNMLMSIPDRHFQTAPVQKTDICLGFVGRFDPEKGIADLIQAMHQLQQKSPVSLTLKLAGAGALESDLNAQTQRLGLEKQVVFSGWVSDLDEWMRDVDLLVVPSLNETFGIAILEGFCHGKPVVSTQVPGPQSLIEAGVNGWLAEPGNPDDLARVLDLAIRQQDQWPQIASCAYDKAKAHHYQQMLPRIAKIVRGVIDR
ncbi:Mannosylfructose-phosphate synthase [Nitrincola nitratireducens]|uniref:Mannosylfructose-phosphate synthase n=3 Tax=Nitrincola TaxID=267849 RepID=W9V627_9GAMM|nr:Mannosylfructose-phosphate synthase [Nitrincola nitratireducens]